MNRRSRLALLAPIAISCLLPLIDPVMAAAADSRPAAGPQLNAAAPVAAPAGASATPPAATPPAAPPANPPTVPPVTPTTAPATTPGTTPTPAPGPGTAPGTPPGTTPVPASPGSPLTLPALPTPPTPAMARVVDIQYTGLKRLSKDIFASHLQTRVGGTFDPAVVEQDAETILNTGYFYTVTPRAEQTANGTVIVFDLVENPLIRSIEIQGNKVIAAADIEKVMLTRPGQVLNTQLVRADLSKIEDYYAKQGYIYAKILDATKVVDINPADNSGVLRIVLTEGVIEDIKIVGNHKTQRFVILRAIKTKPNSVFNLTKWRDDLKALARLNIFSDIHYDTAPGSEVGRIVLILTVVEQRTGNVNFGFGYNTLERGVVFLDLADTNFRGRAETVDAQVELGGYQTRGSYRFAFYEPWLGKSDYSAGLNIYKQQTDRIVPGLNSDSVSGRYLEDRTGAALTLGRHVSQTNQLLMDLKSEQIASDQIYGSVVSIVGGSVVSSSSNVNPFLLQSGTITSATLRGIHDTRDLALNPRTGEFAELILEPGVGTFKNPGDSANHPFNYVRFSADLRKYIPVGRLTHKEGLDIQKVFAMRLMYGKSTPGVPAFQYFFLGGADTLRGYQDDNFFGENMLLYSAELRIPLALSKLQYVLFSDIGDAWGGNYTADKHFQLYPAVGMGVRVVIPQIGPLRLDYGFGKFGGRTHFSIGQTF